MTVAPDHQPVSSAAPAGDHGHDRAAPEPPEFHDEAYARASALFRAAGDPQRLRTLAQLARGERCVTELATAFGAGLSTVSQRLRVLRAEGLLARRREGKHVYYRLADQHVAELIGNALAHASEPDQHGRAHPDGRAATGSHGEDQR